MPSSSRLFKPTFEDETNESIKKGDSVDFENPMSDDLDNDRDRDFENPNGGLEVRLVGDSGKSNGQVDPRKLSALVANRAVGESATALDALNQVALRNKCLGLLHPDTSVRKCYDAMHVCVLAYFAYMIPLRIGFRVIPTTTENAIDLGIDALIFLDLCINFFAFYYDNQGVLVSQGSRIRKNYLRSWFIVDLCSCVPLDQIVRLVATLIDSSHLDAIGKQLRLCRFLRFLRLARLPKMLNLREVKSILNFFGRKFGLSTTLIDFALTLSVLIGVMLTTAHMAGCYWALAGHKGFSDSDPPVGWMSTLYDTDTDGLAPSLEVTYTDAIYFSIVTVSSVGYGDILATTTEEKSIVVSIIILGAFLYAFVIGNFCAMVEEIGHDRHQFDSKMRSVSEMMKFYGVTWEIEQRAIDFYEFKYSNHTLYDDEAIMNELPTSLQDTIVLQRFADTIKLVPFFRGIRDDVCVGLCSHMKNFGVMPTEKVTEKGEFHRELVILTRGVVSTISPKAHIRRVLDIVERIDNPATYAALDEDGDGKLSRAELQQGLADLGEQLTNEEMDTIMGMLDGTTSADDLHNLEDITAFYEVGSFFGELEFLGVSKQRAVTTEAVVYSEVATLLPEDIAGVVEQHPFLRERIQQYARLRQEAEDMVSAGAAVQDLLDKLESAARQVQKINDVEGPGDGHDTRTDTGLTVAQQLRKVEERLDQRVDRVEKLLVEQTATLLAALGGGKGGFSASSEGSVE